MVCEFYSSKAIFKKSQRGTHIEKVQELEAIWKKCLDLVFRKVHLQFLNKNKQTNKPLSTS